MPSDGEECLIRIWVDAGDRSLIVEHELGYVHANAGIDRSNVEGGDHTVLLLPVDPDASAARLRAELTESSGIDIAVIINDSAGRAWREGAIGFALGTAGFEPVVDLLGKRDLLGRPMEVTSVAVADELAAAASPPLVIFLQGELGMGKTTLSRGFIQALGHGGAVKSPTYTLVEPYELDGQAVYHFDLYRLGDPEELEFMGIRDYFTSQALCLVEWPERGLGVLPPADLVITIEPDGLGRRLQLRAISAGGMAVTAHLRDKS